MSLKGPYLLTCQCLPGTPFNPDAIRVNQLFVLAALRVKPASQPRFIFLLSRTRLSVVREIYKADGNSSLWGQPKKLNFSALLKGKS